MNGIKNPNQEIRGVYIRQKFAYIETFKYIYITISQDGN